MTKHTPGPWKTEKDDGHTCVYSGAAHPNGRRNYVHHGCEERHRDIEESQANARLIAAAPKMLEALKLACKELNAIRARDGAPQAISWDRGQPMQISLCTEEWWNELTDKCTDAIDKAEGSVE